MEYRPKNYLIKSNLNKNWKSNPNKNSYDTCWHNSEDEHYDKAGCQIGRSIDQKSMRPLQEGMRVGNAVPCGFCELWFHSDCIDGMTAEFVESCEAINILTGGSSFLCAICRKLSTKINGSMNEAIKRMKKLEQRLVTADLERKCMAEKVNAMETQNRQVNENVSKIETEVASEMEKAKEEVKGEMRDEMKERDDEKGNIAVHGVAESKETNMKKNRQEDLDVVNKIAAEIGVKCG